MPKKRTTINIDEDLLDAVSESGVKNFSAHVEKLCKIDLASVEREGKEQVETIEHYNDILKEVEEEWMNFEKRSSSSE